MSKYIIDLKMPAIKNAGPKARNDVNFFLPDMGYQLITLFYPLVYRRIITPLTLLPYGFMYFIKLFFKFKKNDVVLIQFPIPNVYIWVFNYLKKVKNIKLIFLIHDLESFRKGNGVEDDLVFFKKADVIIAHNQKMTDLIKRPFLTSKIIELEVFDYKVNSSNTAIETNSQNPANITINYAGNLAADKSGFIYNISSLHFKENIKMVVFGINYDSAKSANGVTYSGVFAPDNPGVLKGDFGLVWDGNSFETCEGIFGSYLKVNNPHKLSLYLAASKPVIVWSEAAVSAFVEKNKVGITVKSLAEIEAKLESLSETEKLQMNNNAKEFGTKVRAGYFIKNAVAKAEKM